MEIVRRCSSSPGGSSKPESVHIGEEVNFFFCCWEETPPGAPGGSFQTQVFEGGRVIHEEGAHTSEECRLDEEEDDESAG